MTPGHIQTQLEAFTQGNIHSSAPQLASALLFKLSNSPSNETFKIDPVPETSGWRSRLEHRGHAACHFRHLDTTREQYPANLKYTKSNVFHVAVSLVLQHLADLR